MATKNKEQKNVPYIYGNKASAVDVVLYEKIDALTRSFEKEFTELKKRVEELENRKPETYNLSFVLPENKPWYKRLFSK